MEMKSLLSLLLLTSLIAIHCPSLTDGSNDSSVNYQEQIPTLLAVGIKKPNRPLTKSYWHKNQKQKFSTRKKWIRTLSFQDEKDLIELDRLKQLDSSHLMYLVESSIVDFADNKYSIKLINPRQALGTTTTTGINLRY